MRKVTLSIRDSGLQLYNYAGLKIQLQWLAYISKSELHANKNPIIPHPAVVIFFSVHPPLSSHILFYTNGLAI